jgi:hypothetical protein
MSQIMSEVDDNVTSVILMLAHDGIKNQAVWKAWLEEAEGGSNVKILAYIQHNEVKTDFENSILACADTCELKTEWGDRSICEVTLLLMKEAVNKFQNVTHVHIVSGRDVPIVTPKMMIESENVSCSLLESGARNSFYVKDGTPHFNKVMNSVLPLSASQKKQLLHINPISRNIMYSSQWMTLIKADVNYLIIFFENADNSKYQL